MEFFRVLGVVGNLGNLREFLFFLGVWVFGEFVILSLLQKGEKSKEFKTRFLDLWILRCAQYDKQKIMVGLGVLGFLREFLFFLGEFGGFEFLGVEFFLGVGFLGL